MILPELESKLRPNESGRQLFMEGIFKNDKFQNLKNEEIQDHVRAKVYFLEPSTSSPLVKAADPKCSCLFISIIS